MQKHPTDLEKTSKSFENVCFFAVSIFADKKRNNGDLKKKEHYALMRVTITPTTKKKIPMARMNRAKMPEMDLRFSGNALK